MAAPEKTGKKPNRGLRGPRPDALTMSIPTAGVLLGKTLNHSYDLAKQGKIPVLLGNRVSKAWLAEVLGVSLEVIDERLLNIAQKTRA
jgi:hypothetical protein